MSEQFLGIRVRVIAVALNERLVGAVSASNVYDIGGTESLRGKEDALAVNVPRVSPRS